jgi:hypothetical protein
MQKDEIDLDARITELKAQMQMSVSKIKMLSSETVIKYMEEDLLKTEQQIADLVAQKEKAKSD